MQEQDFCFSLKVLELCGEKDIRVLLNLLRLKEPEAYVHSMRVSSFMDAIFHASEDVLRGSLLHDIGKSAMPFNLTLFPCALTENEKKIVDAHTLLGAEILSGYNDTILDCVLYHHDGLYPVEYVQQLRACDIFDALTNNRPYRKACTANEAKEIMLKMGIKPLYTNAITMWYNTVNNKNESEAIL